VSWCRQALVSALLADPVCRPSARHGSDTRFALPLRSCKLAGAERIHFGCISRTAHEDFCTMKIIVHVRRMHVHGQAGVIFVLWMCVSVIISTAARAFIE